ncbi:MULTISPECIES: hypothetical protein [Olivibacter]|uniref:Protofilament ribbon protein n=2 Tax=Sphingobacteriaceae TaxID=84566 RepID=F4C9G4_SPHS2|nr:hypothetical protein [Olivibacter sp. 47]MDM8175833.1 hypothetical protein [Olivibacter sp. 47]
MDNLNKRKVSKQQKAHKKRQEKSNPPETNRSAITGHNLEDDITGANPAGSAVRPDILREDHPGLAK